MLRLFGFLMLILCLGTKAQATESVFSFPPESFKDAFVAAVQRSGGAGSWKARQADSWQMKRTEDSVEIALSPLSSFTGTINEQGTLHKIALICRTARETRNDPGYVQTGVSIYLERCELLMEAVLPGLSKNDLAGITLESGLMDLRIDGEMDKPRPERSVELRGIHFIFGANGESVYFSAEKYEEGNDP
ncbi:MAG: hypothetical protein FWG17_05720 [Desulfovibrionaceae bacterium]|nr:hypothetical protein [Desulfovibrionaceae bacterium]